MQPSNLPNQLTTNEIHLWMLNPKQIPATSTLRRLLSDSEKEKVDRYRLPVAQHTALITRAFIRLLLSQYGDLAPQAWQFAIDSLGKPELKNNPLKLRFNLSHNDELIICALCLESDIGCDIENLARKINVNGIAKRFFSQQEAQLIAAQPSLFFEYWTLKEAFVKATGLGISQGLETFSFEIKPANEAHFNDNIRLSFEKKCQQQAPEDWYQALLFPDDKHCIGLSLNTSKQTNKKPAISLFSIEQGAALFNSSND